MIERLTAGIDWVSCTLGKGEQGYQIWKGEALYALQKVCDEGYQLLPRKLQGFEGLSAGNCFVGENDYRGFVQFTGEKADWAYDYVMHPKAHYARIDIQLTVKTDILDANEGKRCYRAAMDNNTSLSTGRRRKIWLIVGSDGGDTLYIGSQSSDQRARIYNKEVQSEDINYTRCWRYEVVLRNELSTQLARTGLNQTTARAEYCLAFCAQWLAKRGVSIPGLVSRTVIALPIERTLPTDIEKKLKWLREQVSPTYRYLCEMGLRDAAEEALTIGGYGVQT
jgi:hypothetical protein